MRQLNSINHCFSFLFFNTPSLDPPTQKWLRSSAVPKLKYCPFAGSNVSRKRTSYLFWRKESPTVIRASHGIISILICVPRQDHGALMWRSLSLGPHKDSTKTHRKPSLDHTDIKLCYSLAMPKKNEFILLYNLMLLMSKGLSVNSASKWPRLKGLNAVSVPVSSKRSHLWTPGHLLYVAAVPNMASAAGDWQSEAAEARLGTAATLYNTRVFLRLSVLGKGLMSIHTSQALSAFQ